jgi:hypothetical protein
MPRYQILLVTTNRYLIITMKAALIILLLFSSISYGQRTPYDRSAYSRSVYDEYKKEDSLEGLHVDITQLKVITDTIPIFSLDEMNSWRDMKLVIYYYDSLTNLRKIFFRDGRRADYTFYFKESNLLKARVKTSAAGTIMKYYFTNEEAIYTFQDIEQKMTLYPAQKTFYEVLAMGKSFSIKFSSLL